MKPRLLFPTVVLALSAAWSGAAFADVPRQDACSSSSTAGSACNNAGDHGDKSGKCEESVCSHRGPGPDGSIVSSSNPCMICKPSSGGSGCSVGAVAPGGPATGTLALFGLAVLLAGRRARTRA